MGRTTLTVIAAALYVTSLAAAAAADAQTPGQIARKQIEAGSARDWPTLRTLYATDVRYVDPNGESRGVDAAINALERTLKPFGVVKVAIAKVYEGKDIRNVGVVGHGHCGKTMLTSALLYTAGAVNRLTRPDEGNTITDFDDEEIQRKLTISTAVAVAEWNPQVQRKGARGARANLRVDRANPRAIQVMHAEGTQPPALADRNHEIDRRQSAAERALHDRRVEFQAPRDFGVFPHGAKSKLTHPEL